MRKQYLSFLLAIIITTLFAFPVMASGEVLSVKADAAQKMLIDGNKRFITEQYAKINIGQDRRTELTKGQFPFAVVVCCSDSRVPPELLFNQGLGDIFVVRVAGNVLGAMEMGSVEYAVEHLGVKLVVVLGHEQCGAVKATVDGGEISPNIREITTKIQPAADSAKAAISADVYEVAADNNINNMVALLNTNRVLAHAEGVTILGAKYHLKSGEVEFFKQTEKRWVQ